MAYRRVAMGQALPIRVTAWYRKSEATLSDVLALVSRVLWAEKYGPVNFPVMARVGSTGLRL